MIILQKLIRKISLEPVEIDETQIRKINYICSICEKKHKYIMLCSECGWDGCENCAEADLEEDAFLCPECLNRINCSYKPSRVLDKSMDRVSQ